MSIKSKNFTLIHKSLAHRNIDFTVSLEDESKIKISSDRMMFDSKGDLFRSKTITAKEPIKNIGAYLYGYLSRTLRYNNKFVAIESDGKRYRFYGVEFFNDGVRYEKSSDPGDIREASRMMVAINVPLKKLNGIPSYSRNHVINQILLASGADACHAKTQQLKVYISQNLTLISYIALELNKFNFDRMSLNMIKRIVNKHKSRLGKVSEHIIKGDIYNFLMAKLGSRNPNDKRKYTDYIGFPQTFSESNLVTLKREWFI